MFLLFVKDSRLSVLLSRSSFKIASLAVSRLVVEDRREPETELEGMDCKLRIDFRLSSDGLNEIISSVISSSGLS